MKSAKLEFCGNSLEFIEFDHSLEDEKLGNPYNCSFGVKVVSGDFAGATHGLEIDYDQIKYLISQLQDLIDFKRDEVLFADSDNELELSFRGDGMGHIYVSGVIDADAGRQRLEFEFITDQTVYASFISELQNL